MGKADETAEHAVTVEAIGEVGVARAADDVAPVPIVARLRVKPRPQSLAIQFRIAGRVGCAEELPEIRIVGKGTQARELQLEERKMRLVEIDRINLRRLSGEIGQRIASARRDGDDGRADGQAKRGEI